MWEGVKPLKLFAHTAVCHNANADALICAKHPRLHPGVDLLPGAAPLPTITCSFLHIWYGVAQQLKHTRHHHRMVRQDLRLQVL